MKLLGVILIIGVVHLYPDEATGCNLDDWCGSSLS